MIWDIIHKKLEDAGYAPPDTIFYEIMPGDLKVGIMLRSPLAGISVDPHLPGYHKAKLQVIVRHTDPVAGDKMALGVIDTLTLVNGVERYPATDDRGAVQLNVFHPIAYPIRYPRLDGGTIEWSINFTASWAIRRPASSGW